MSDGKNIADNLSILKNAFGAISERDLIVKHILALGKTNLKFLDIGIGDCKSTFKIYEDLKNLGVTLQVVGVDPELDAKTKSFANEIGFRVFEEGIDDLPIKLDDFDIVNVRQSLYYSKSFSESIENIIKSTNNNALIFVTIWNDKCNFRGMHLYIFDRLKTENKIVSSGALSSALEKLANLCTYTAEDVCGDLDIKLLADSAPHAKAAFDIASRNCVKDVNDDEKVDMVKDFLSSIKDKKPERINTLFSIYKK